jgi:replicative DNA helicase
VDIDRLRALCYRQQVSDGLDLVVVDYLQLLRSGEQHRSEVEEVTAISRKLKALAMDVQVALLSLSQLRRRQAEEKAPTLWDLRQSGAIEQDADYVLLLHWKQRSENTDVGVRSMELYVAKNRHGPLTRPDQPLRYDFEAATGLWREHEGRKGKGLYLGEEQWPV